MAVKPIRLVVAGSRSFKVIDGVRLLYLLTKKEEFRAVAIREIVLGGHPEGIDEAGRIWARRVGILPKFFYPEYHRYNPKRAPLVRNTKMAEYGDALLLIWDGQSTGSWDMFQKARLRGLPVFLSRPTEASLNYEFIPAGSKDYVNNSFLQVCK